ASAPLLLFLNLYKTRVSGFVVFESFSRRDALKRRTAKKAANWRAVLQTSTALDILTGIVVHACNLRTQKAKMA
ncbi:hypothetical protein STEG23_009093, partial [Scotinomys teguina]